MIHFIKEIFEFCSKQNFLSYFVSLENLVELVIFLLGWVFLIASNYDIEIAYHASAWMIFWAWINLLLYMGRLNLIGKYIFMCLHVIKILCLCLFAYLPVFFAFTFDFSMQHDLLYVTKPEYIWKCQECIFPLPVK